MYVIPGMVYSPTGVAKVRSGATTGVEHQEMQIIPVLGTQRDFSAPRSAGIIQSQVIFNNNRCGSKG